MNKDMRYLCSTRSKEKGLIFQSFFYCILGDPAFWLALRNSVFPSAGDYDLAPGLERIPGERLLVGNFEEWGNATNK